MTSRPRGFSALFVAALLACASCGGTPPKPAVSEEAPKGPVLPPNMTLLHKLGDVSRPSMGPYRAVGPEGSLLVYAASANEGTQLLSLALFPDGAPKGVPKPLGVIPFETRALVVKPLGRGFIVCYTSPVGENDAIVSVVLNEEGKPVAAASEVVKTPSPIGWFEVVPNKAGVVVVWAETTPSENASIFAVAMDTRGSVISAPSRVASHAVSWQLHESEEALVLGSISAIPVLDGEKRAPAHATAATQHTIVLQQIDQEARPLGAATVVAKGRAAARDLDFYEGPNDHTRVVWTELDGGVPRPMQATLEHRTNASPPEVVESARGGGRVLSLTRHVLMWRGPVSANRVYLTDLTKPKELRWSFDADDGRPPEFVTAGDGFAVLGLTRMCPQTSSNADACDRLPKRQTLARLDANLAVRETTFLGKLTAESVEPSLAWALHCTDKECSMLGATGANVLQLSSLRVPNGLSQKEVQPAPAVARALAPTALPPAALPKADDAPPPVVSSLGVGKVGAPVPVLPGFTPAAFSSPEGRFVAVVGEREGKKGPQDDAEIVILSADGTGPSAEVASITKRALARGGVALAQGGSAKDGYALVWVALEQGDPEVHLSRLDKTGHRVSDMLLTTVKGDARNVSVRWVGDGYMVAWIDGRDGVGEVYVTKVNPALERITRQTRVTNAPGDASDLVMVRAEGPKAPIFLSWVKPTGPVTATDVYVARISAHNAERIGNETRLLASPSPSRRPMLSAKPDGGVSVLWLEDEAAARGTQSDQAIYSVSIDNAGKLEGVPGRLFSVPNAQASTLAPSESASFLADVQEANQSSIVLLRPFEKSPAALRLVTGFVKKKAALTASKTHVWYSDPKGPGILRAALSNEP
ncbi:MAG: hypothetical protein U0174_24775 [Polyangiaceae bacterium]